ncbi:MAG: DUF1631 family protein [Burkholderiales bacterium]|nr:DUF1631 family protein [Burkholderiales bacterium]
MSGPTYGVRASAADAPQALSPAALEEGRALLRACFAQYRLRLLEVIRGSLAEMDDLFESGSHIPDGEVELFRKQQPAWLDQFDRTLCELFERRVVDGARRRGRRPDADASLATLRVLTAFDHDRQAALKDATRFLDRFTQREIAALDLRVETLLGERVRDADNPFAVSYVLDAVGASARKIYPNPRVWRPFMERVLGDLTPEINKLYVTLNRFLADRGVLPEIKAALRARSQWRPHDDGELLSTFGKMIEGATPGLPQDVVVPELANPHAAPAFVFADKAPPVRSIAPITIDSAQEMSATRILAGLATLAKAMPTVAGTRAAAANGSAAESPTGPETAGAATVAAEPAAAHAEGAFPSLDPLLALGAATPLFTALARWQQLDLPAALARLAPPTAPGATEGVVVPINLIPHLRAAIGDQIESETDRITMDVIALLFDYIFRDPSIPDAQRSLFGRLQVPIVKAALLDRQFFSDKAHPARALLDNLAEGAVGATADDAYQRAFGELASSIVGEICQTFDIDIDVFRAANARLAAFIDSERQKITQASSVDVEAALHAEASEADRSQVRAFLRDRLAGTELPFEVRGFVETAWADYLTQLRRDHGPEGEASVAAVKTLDDLLWSIVAKERSAQKARLTKMIPSLIGALRKGAAAVGTPPERSRAFLEALYELHIAAIKTVKDAPTAGTPSTAAPLPKVSMHDYVNEMAVGTWLAFTKEGQAVSARLTWVSPLRTKYLFTSRSRARAFVYSPEELAYEIGAGLVALVVEPVPLFDRAVSAALDSLGIRQPAAGAPA